MAAETCPEILAPAGDTDCFLAALAAGANGIYLGLKNFSARMEAKNFGLSELARLVELAHANHCRVYVAMNNMLKERELEQAYRLVKRLAEQVNPDGLIIQDLALPAIARQAGFAGGLAFSTLANVSSAPGLTAARRCGASRVILPRELSIDEIRSMGDACPPGLELECFVQGALCYCVSGRCYWSSYMGGKSGLRGRCVQPCRRQYARIQPTRPKGRAQGQRLFACQDLELAPVINALLTVPHLASWKIEGRKKGPHYVFHAVTAYRILRDYPDDPRQRKMAREILEMALGRPGVRARFLPQKKAQPMAPHGQTSSGLLAGKISIQQNGACVIKPHFDLLPKDFLRVGVEDESWHHTLAVSRRAPKGGVLSLNLPKHKTPKAGTPVYLIDRREPELARLLKEWQAKLAAIPSRQTLAAAGALRLPKPAPAAQLPDMIVRDRLMPAKAARENGLSRRAMQCVWLSPKCESISRTMYAKMSFWLPPAIWPEKQALFERLIARLWQNGARDFVCNAPWQRAFFPAELPDNARLVAGPFCNAANALALQTLKDLGFAAACGSQELSGEDILALPRRSPLPLGIVLGGYWPVGLSRFGLAGLEAGDMFASPKGEIFWSRDRAGMTWIFPAWPLNLTEKRSELAAAGYSFLVWLEETPPRELPRQNRPSLFNWNCQLL